MDKFKIYDQYNNLVNTLYMEPTEQIIADQIIQEDDVVLELGARYGSVSCIINSKLKNKNNQVVVEPDNRVWEALEHNKKINNCGFHIVKGFIGNKKMSLTNLDDWFGGYGATFVLDDNSNIPSYTMDEIKKSYGIEKFNVLIADCEGFLEVFFDENPYLYDELSLIFFEEDYTNKCNYDKIKMELINKGFSEVINGKHSLWINKTRHHPIPNF